VILNRRTGDGAPAGPRRQGVTSFCSLQTTSRDSRLILTDDPSQNQPLNQTDSYLLLTMATISLIKEAIIALKDRTGSSSQAINKYIEGEKKVR
jgi:hypothetical protein